MGLKIANIPAAAAAAGNLFLHGIGLLTRTIRFDDYAAWALKFGDGPLPQNLFQNLSLVCSISSGALTIAIKGKDGSDPSALNPVRIAFRNSSPTTADYTIITLTTPTSFTVSSGSMVGQQSGFSWRMWIVAFNDGGAVRLGVINCRSDSGGVTAAIYPLASTGIGSSTAEGGAGGADNTWTFYTGTAVTSKAYTILGYLTYETALGTLGVYNALPDALQLFGPTVPLPGHVVQIGHQMFPLLNTGTTIMPSDDTIPQRSEGDEYMTVTLSAISGANVGVLECHLNLSSSAAGTLTTAIFSNSTTDAFAATANVSESPGRMFQQTIRFARLLGRLTPIVVSVRAGNSAPGTTTFNGVNGARLYGGSYSSYIQFMELQS